MRPFPVFRINWECKEIIRIQLVDSLKYMTFKALLIYLFHSASHSVGACKFDPEFLNRSNPDIVHARIHLNFNFSIDTVSTFIPCLNNPIILIPLIYVSLYDTGVNPSHIHPFPALLTHKRQITLPFQAHLSFCLTASVLQTQAFGFSTSHDIFINN